MKLQWYHFTRGFGVAMMVYGLLVDKTPERTTVILAGAGVAGFDKVQRSDDKDKK